MQPRRDLGASHSVSGQQNDPRTADVPCARVRSSDKFVQTFSNRWS